jgi:hypothetical protein
MAIFDEIPAARGYGVVRCGLSSQPSPTVPDLACEFGLLDDPACYREIDREAARRLVQLILHRDLAYFGKIMSQARAVQLAECFLDQFDTHARFYTNGTFHESPEQLTPAVRFGLSWDAVTNATFDTGVLVISPQGAGCLWVEDED